MSLASTQITGPGFDVTHAGVVGDGVTNDSPALASAVARVADGGTLWVPSNKRIRLNETVWVRNKTVHFQGAGDGSSTFLQGSNVDMLRVQADYDIVDASAPRLTEQTLHPADRTTTTVFELTVAAVPAGLAAGDRVVVVSEDAIPDTHARADGSYMRMGEALTVAQINGNDISFTGIPLEWKTYQTGIRLAPLPPYTFSMRGLNLETDESGLSSWWRFLLQIDGMLFPKIENVHVPHACSRVVGLGGCYGWSVDDLSVDYAGNEGSVGQYGYGLAVLGYSASGRVENSFFHDCRHGITTDTPARLTPTDDLSQYGSSKFNNVSNSVGDSCSGSAFDLHTGARHWTFSDCKASNSWRGSTSAGTGFQVRGKGVELNGCENYGGQIGFMLSDQGQNGCSDVTLTDCSSAGSEEAVLVNGTAGPIENVKIIGGEYTNDAPNPASRVIQSVRSDLHMRNVIVKGSANMAHGTLVAMAQTTGDLFAVDCHFDTSDMPGAASGATLADDSQTIELVRPTFNMQPGHNFVRGNGTGGRLEVLDAKCEKDVTPSNPVWGPGASVDWNYRSAGTWVSGSQ